MSTTFYSIEAGDELYRILRDHYGDKTFFEQGETLINLVRKNNPHIKNIDLIYPGQTVALSGVPGKYPILQDLAPGEAELTAQISNELSQSPATVRSALSNITAERIAKEIGTSYVSYVKSQSQDAISAMSRVAKNYDNKAMGQISRGAYDGRRIKYMSQYDRSLGALKPMHRPLVQSRAVLHISPKSTVPAASLINETKTLTRYLKLASKGVVILKVASVAETASNIAMSDTGSEQVGVLAKAGGGIGGGVIGAAAGGLIFGALILSPVGWVAISGILLAGATGVGGSLLGEELAERASENLLYGENGQAIYKDKLFQGSFR